MERPSTTGYTVYTKENCRYCRRVKEILPTDTKYVSCDTFLLEDREAFLETMDTLTGKKHRTFPFVFLDKIFIGGCDDTEMYIAFQRYSNF